jgi:hypothetical protein
MYDILCPELCDLCPVAEEEEETNNSDSNSNSNSDFDLGGIIEGNIVDGQPAPVPVPSPTRPPVPVPSPNRPPVPAPITLHPTINFDFGYYTGDGDGDGINDSQSSVFVGLSMSTLSPEQRARIRQGKGVSYEDYQQLVTASDIRMGRNNAQRLLDAVVLGLVQILDATPEFRVLDYTYDSVDQLQLDSNQGSSITTTTALAYNPSNRVASAADGANGWLRVFVPLEILAVQGGEGDDSYYSGRRNLVESESTKHESKHERERRHLRSVLAQGSRNQDLLQFQTHHDSAADRRKLQQPQRATVNQVSQSIAIVMQEKIRDGTLLEMLQLSDDRIQSLSTIGQEDLVAGRDGEGDGAQAPVSGNESESIMTAGGIFGIVVLAVILLVGSLLFTKLVVREKKSRAKRNKRWQHMMNLAEDEKFAIKSLESGSQQQHNKGGGKHHPYQSYKDDEFEYDLPRTMAAAQFAATGHDPTKFVLDDPKTPDRLNRTTSTDDDDDDSFAQIVKSHKKKSPEHKFKFSNFLFYRAGAALSPIRASPDEEEIQNNQPSRFDGNHPNTRSVRPPASIVVPVSPREHLRSHLQKTGSSRSVSAAAVPPADISPTPSFILDGDENNSLEGSLHSSSKLFAKIRAARMQFLSQGGDIGDNPSTLGPGSTLEGDNDTLLGDNDTLPGAPRTMDLDCDPVTDDQQHHDFPVRSGLDYLENDDFDALYDDDDDENNNADGHVHVDVVEIEGLEREREDCSTLGDNSPSRGTGRAPGHLDDDGVSPHLVAGAMPQQVHHDLHQPDDCGQGLEDAWETAEQYIVSPDCGAHMVSHAWTENTGAFANALEHPQDYLQTGGCLPMEEHYGGHHQEPVPPPPPPMSSKSNVLSSPPGAARGRDMGRRAY